MIKYFLTYITLLCTMCSVAQPLVDGFFKAPGDLDVVASYTYERFDRYYAAPGLLDIGRTSHIVSPYAALGISKGWNVQMAVPMMKVGTETGLQDLSLVTKVRLIETSGDKTAFTTGISSGISFPMMNYETETLNALGQRATVLDNRLLLQLKHHASGFFVMTQGGYAYALDPVPSAVVGAFKAGLAKQKYYMDAWLDVRQGEEGNSYRDGNRASFRTFTVSYIKTGVTTFKPLNDTQGLALTLSKVWWGENVGRSTAVSLAYIHKLQVANR